MLLNIGLGKARQKQAKSPAGSTKTPAFLRGLTSAPKMANGQKTISQWQQLLRGFELPVLRWYFATLGKGAALAERPDSRHTGTQALLQTDYLHTCLSIYLRISICISTCACVYLPLAQHTDLDILSHSYGRVSYTQDLTKQSTRFPINIQGLTSPPPLLSLIKRLATPPLRTLAGVTTWCYEFSKDSKHYVEVRSYQHLNGPPNSVGQTSWTLFN